MIKTYARLAAALVVATSLGGCVSLLPKAKPVQLYRFGVTGASTAPPIHADERGVLLEPVTFPREAMSDGILTVEGTQTSYITGGRWVAPATILFRQALDQAFDASGPHTRLLSRGETGRAASLLQVEVVRFEADYTDPKAAPIIHVSIQGRLAAPDGQPIDAQVFDVQRPASENRIAAIVGAYDAATSEALTGLVRWVDAKTPPLPPIGSAPASTSTSTYTKSTTTRRP
jgi:cholesterol transport system auxiliary component